MPHKQRARGHWWSVTERLDGLLFAFAGLSALWLAYLLLREGVRPGWPMLILVVFWVVFTYLVLPRLHRILTRLYVPGYFIGRTRTSDGLLGDPVNIALMGTEAQIHQVMRAAGWTRADDLSLASSRKMVGSTLRRRSYPNAPVSPLLLFDRQQDFAYQQEVGGSTSQRHHVRFWRCPEGWLLPGGYRVDWLAAGTYDRSVGLSLFTLQITHKIEADTDIERDYIVSTVRQAEPGVELRVIEDFSTGYHSRNGGGDLIQTDGDLPILDLSAVRAPAELEPARQTDSRDKRPAQIVFGALVAFGRAALFLALAAVVIAASQIPEAQVEIDTGLGLTPGDAEVGLVVIGILLLLGAMIDVVFGIGVLRGYNWARMLLMIYSSAAIVIAFVQNASGTEPISLRTNLITVAISILVLLALSSRPARDYAIRPGTGPVLPSHGERAHLST
ncbi:MAG TPA: LssY C-terminal domain-containing protein [Microlunatus sp.]|nr:LssY C-terminal domain-containing protein [Microlunatus sp.]